MCLFVIKYVYVHMYQKVLRPRDIFYVCMH